MRQPPLPGVGRPADEQGAPRLGPREARPAGEDGEQVSCGPSAGGCAVLGAGASGGPGTARGRTPVPSPCASPRGFTCRTPRQGHRARLRAHPHPLCQRRGQRAEPQQLQVRVPELRDVPHGHRQEHHAPAGQRPRPWARGFPRATGRSFQKYVRIPPRAPDPRAVPSAPVRVAWPSASIRERWFPQRHPPRPAGGRVPPLPRPLQALSILARNGVFCLRTLGSPRELSREGAHSSRARAWFSESGYLEKSCPESLEGAGRARGPARLTPVPSQYCVCIDDCSSSNCMCGQLSLRCWYDQVSPPRRRPWRWWECPRAQEGQRSPWTSPGEEGSRDQGPRSEP